MTIRHTCHGLESVEDQVSADIGSIVCHGIVTADVLKLGLSRGAIAARKLEGVNGTRNTRVILVRPLTVKVKAYVQLRWY